MSKAALAIYLNDHLGLITGEIELARRVMGENEGTPLARFLSSYANDVTQQREAVKNVLASIGQQPSSWKQAAGWLAEKVGRLKPNDALTGYTDLARVIELEAMLSAAQARLMMWETLCRVLPDATAQPAARKELAWQHVKTLQDHHVRVVQLTFATV